jgi:hypothetical protein
MPFQIFAIRDKPKIVVWYCVLYDRVIGAFFSHEQTVNAINHFDLLDNYALLPQLKQV